MSSAGFDTPETGVECQRAEANATVTRRAVATDRETLAMKADIAGLEARIYRALWIQGMGTVVIVGGFIVLADTPWRFGGWRIQQRPNTVRFKLASTRTEQSPTSRVGKVRDSVAASDSAPL